MSERQAVGATRSAEPPTEVRFEDRQRVFALFAEAIAGRYTHVGPADSAGLPGPQTGEAPVVVVPARIDDYLDARHNAGAYRVAILRQVEAFQSGVGTFDLDAATLISELSEGATAALKLPVPYKPVVNVHLDRFFATIPRGELISRLLPVLEDVRVDAAVSDRFPGARPDLIRSRAFSLRALDLAAHDPSPPDALSPAAQSAATFGPAELVLYALKRFACGDPFTAVKHTPKSPLARMLTAAARLSNPTATVYSSATAAIEIAGLVDEFVEFLRQNADPLDDAEARESTDAPSPDTPPAVGGTQDADRVDEVELSPEDMTGTRANFDLDDFDDAASGRGHGSSQESIEESAPTLKESDPTRTPTLEVTGVETTDPTGDPPRLPTRPSRPTIDQRTYFYHEWDYTTGTYLPSWCRLQERRLKGANFGFIHDVRRRHSMLAHQVRRRFTAIRPEAWHRVHRTPDGDEMSLDSLVETVVDRRSGHATDEHLYIRRERAVRDVAAAFLLDMSRSTDSPVTDPNAVVVPPPVPTDPEEQDPYLRGSYFDLDEFVLDLTPKRRVIDVAKESLALMCDALQTLGDNHAIYGFSGSGRHNVEFHVAKEFTDPTSTRTWAALGAMEPIRYTRMGPAIRHAANKLGKQPERTKVLLVVTDGYPQDEGYGPDRNDRNYGIHDTAKALEEAEAAGISTFCITIDPAGHDYLRRMCAEHRYLVIDDVHTLAEELEKVYRTLTGRGPSLTTT